MKVSLLLALSLALTSLSAQVAWNTKLLSSVDGLDGSYNDVWGYEHNGGEYAVLGGRTSLAIIDVTDCAAPSTVYHKTGLDYTTWRDCKDYGDYVYCVDDDAQAERMYIINKNTYTETEHSVTVGSFTRSHNIFIDTLHARLYVVGSSGSNNLGSNNIGVYDLNANPANPPLLASVNLKTAAGDNSNTSYYIHDIYVKDHIGYASHGYSGLMIWDFSDLTNVQRLGVYPRAGYYNHSSWLHPDADILYLAFEVPRGEPMFVLDVSDPSNIQKLYDFADPDLAPAHTDATPHNPFVKDDKLYISYYEDGIKIYDVSDPFALPVYIAKYDTYTSNTSYAGYNGNWGAYPFLSSGCILASDISTGLYVIKEIYAPEAIMEVDDHMVFSGADNFLLQDINENLYRFDIDPLTSKVNLLPQGSGTPAMTAQNADIYFSTLGRGPIFRQGLQYYIIRINTDGTLGITPVLSPPAGVAELSAGAFDLDNYQAGLILPDAQGTCWKIFVNDGGELETQPIACP